MYAKEFVLDTTSTANIATLDAECVVEATCGFAQSFAAEQARIRYGTATITVTSGTISATDLPDELDTTVFSPAALQVVLGDTDIQTTAELQAGLTSYDDADDDFTNYSLTGTIINGDGTVTVEYRVGQHRAECSIDTCFGPLHRTYEIEDRSRAELNALALPAFETVNGTRVRTEEPLNVHQNNGICNTCEETEDECQLASAGRNYDTIEVSSCSGSNGSVTVTIPEEQGQ